MMMLRKQFNLFLGLTVALLLVPSPTWAQTKLNINGKSVSTAAKKMGGKTYVPIEDVAKALGYSVFVSGGTITLRPAGGTYQVANKLKGNMNEDLFSGLYGFKVLSVERVKSYKPLYPNSNGIDEEQKADEGGDLVVVHCRLKNGTKEKDEFVFSKGDYGLNTALTDTDAQSYQAAFFDVLTDEGAPPGKNVLPGASLNFAIGFKVVPSTTIKDVVFSVVRYKERGDKKSTDFRVSLK